jgi:hypothetical protein
MKHAFTLLLVFISALASAQRHTLLGNVFNEKAQPMEYVSAALLNPADSTLAFFGITGSDGNFAIRDVASGDYLLQLSFVGYQTQVHRVQVPLVHQSNLGDFVMQPQAVKLNEVNVSADRIPLQIRGDTVEYDAKAFNTSPDANAEDLLKKLPGVQVDQAGNIKAQGEDVNKVLVDGKEFFSSDPKVAAKNLPADAIDKVQVFDKKSDETEFTGIDDGERDKTINLLLKEDKKSAWLGDVQAGAGTDKHYMVNAKAYRFTQTDQFAALGMLNNINQFGFSFSDYVDFNGGIRSMMQGGGFRIESSDDIPVNFGQQINGLITSGSGGLNFTHEAKPGNRINFSYLGNGYDKDLSQNTLTQNFTPDYSFGSSEESDQITKSLSNRINFNLRNRPDSMQSIFANATISLVNSKRSGSGYTQTSSADSLTNALTSETYDRSNGLKGNASSSYILKGRGSWKTFKGEVNVSAKTTLTETEWNNLTQFFDSGEIIDDSQYQNDQNYQVDVSGGLSADRKLKEAYYFEPSLRAGGTYEVLNREQGIADVEDSEIDSLSPDFSRSNQWLRMGVAIKHSTKEAIWRVALAAEAISLQNILNEAKPARDNQFYLLPRLSLEKTIRRGMNLNGYYEAAVNAPSASQLLPVANTANPLQVFTGNIGLKPEYSHRLNVHYSWFDQFSFTSLFTGFNVRYTKDRINYSKTISDDLSQSLTLVNVPYDYTAGFNAEFSTPIRPAHLNFRVGFQEDYSRGINYVNGDENHLSSFTHSLKASFDNRKKDKFDITFGGNIALTNADYSIDEGSDSRYFDWSYFTEIHYTPTKQWLLSFNADVNHYGAEGYDLNTIVPLLQAEVVRYFLKANRGSVSIKGFDLLNRNSGISQVSEYNYLQRTESNTIGRYFMLSFKYRLSKFGDSGNSVDIEINGR